MIIVFIHEDMSSKLMGSFYDNLYHFAIDTFKIEISEKGVVNIGNYVFDVSYKIGTDSNQYTKEEALKAFSQSKGFKRYARSRFYTAYSIKEKIM
jgi:hypothetical protein